MMMGHWWSGDKFHSFGQMVITASHLRFQCQVHTAQVQLQRGIFQAWGAGPLLLLQPVMQSAYSTSNLPSMRTGSNK